MSQLNNPQQGNVYKDRKVYATNNTGRQIVVEFGEQKVQPVKKAIDTLQDVQNVTIQVKHLFSAYDILPRSDLMEHIS